MDGYWIRSWTSIRLSSGTEEPQLVVLLCHFPLCRLDEAVPLVQELEHALAALKVGGIGGKLEPAPRPHERHVEHLADMRGRSVGHHHDAIREQHRLVDVMGDHQPGVAQLPTAAS